MLLRIVKESSLRRQNSFEGGSPFLQERASSVKALELKYAGAARGPASKPVEEEGENEVWSKQR